MTSAPFGPDLVPAGVRGRACPLDTGECSLAIMRASHPFEVYLSAHSTLRARVADDLDLSVTDLRLYEDDLRTPSGYKVQWLNRRLKYGGEIYLCCGLSRPFRRSSDDQLRHWLQLNNIHLTDAPDWQLRWPRERYLE